MLWRHYCGREEIQNSIYIFQILIILRKLRIWIFANSRWEIWHRVNICRLKFTIKHTAHKLNKSNNNYIQNDYMSARVRNPCCFLWNSSSDIEAHLGSLRMNHLSAILRFPLHHTEGAGSVWYEGVCVYTQYSGDLIWDMADYGSQRFHIDPYAYIWLPIAFYG